MTSRYERGSLASRTRTLGDRCIPSLARIFIAGSMGQPLYKQTTTRGAYTSLDRDASTSITEIEASRDQLAYLGDLDDTLARRDGEGLQSRTHSQLAEDAGNTGPLLFDAYAQFLGDSLAVKALGQRLDHFPFARG
jgi:hypothetical protein